ncbi:LysR family transcriptional regulator [Rhodococcus opacus]|nr:LysR family transcriptional regulator [Rhodococcus opacus]
METRRLEYFRTVAREGNFSRAAEILLVSQSALSQQIQRLEDDLGAELLDRRTRPVSLTPIGVSLMNLSDVVLRQVESIEKLRASVRSGETGSLRVGIIPSSLFGQIPARIRRFRGQHPDVTVSLHRMDTSVVVDAVATGRCDVGFVTSEPRDDRVASVDLYSDPFVVALPADHRLAARRRVALKDLRDDDVVMFPREAAPGNFDRVISACVTAGFSPKVLTVAGGYASQIGYVATGLGVALLPDELGCISNDGVVRRPLHGSDLALTTRLLWRQTKTGPLVDKFVAEVRADTGASS